MYGVFDPQALTVVATFGIGGGILGAIAGARRNDPQERAACPSVGFLYGIILGTIGIIAWRVIQS